MADVPEQTGFDAVKIDTLAVKPALMVIVTVFEVAGLPVIHAAFEVSIHATASLLTGVYINVGLFVPVLTPLTFH